MNHSVKQNVVAFCLVFVIGVYASASSSAAIIFESGTLGPTNVTWQQALDGDVPGENLSGSAFSGVRFEITKPVLTTEIGGHFIGPPNSNGTFFASIIELDDEADFPDSEDLSTSDIVGTTLLTFPEPSDEVFGHLELHLGPGWYGLVFGSGLFGATGNGGILLNNSDIEAPDYIGFLSGFGWGNRLPGKRIVIHGTIIPEPTVLALISTASILLLICRLRH